MGEFTVGGRVVGLPKSRWRGGPMGGWGVCGAYASNRRAIVLYAPAAGSYAISDSPAITNGQGLILIARGELLMLDSAVVGDLTQQSLYVIGSGTLSFGFIEVTE